MGIFKYYRRHFFNKRTNTVLISLLILDLIFIIMDIIGHYLIRINPLISPLTYDHFYVTSDGGYPEYFQYLKYISSIVICLFLIIKNKDRLYISWLLLFVMMLLDDALSFHENAAGILIRFFKIKSVLGINLQIIGELLYAASVGSILFSGIALTYYIGNKSYKNTCIDIILLFGLFLFFGLGVDSLHAIFQQNEYIRYSLGLLEDGGEMIVLSLITWYFLFIPLRNINHNHFLFNYFEKTESFLRRLV